MLFFVGCLSGNLEAETVQSTTLALQSVDNIQCGHSLAAGVLTEGDSIANDGFQEDLQHTASFDVDVGGDTLDTTTASEAADGGLGDTLDGVTCGHRLTGALNCGLTKTLTGLTTTCHCFWREILWGKMGEMRCEG